MGIQREILCGYPEFFAFIDGRQIFLLINVVDPKLQIFLCGRHQRSFFANFILFLPNVMTFFQKTSVMISLIDNIFRNSVEISTWFNQKLNILSTIWKSWKFKVITRIKKNICGKAKKAGSASEISNIYYTNTLNNRFLMIPPHRCGCGLIHFLKYQLLTLKHLFQDLKLLCKR